MLIEQGSRRHPQDGIEKTTTLPRLLEAPRSTVVVVRFAYCILLLVVYWINLHGRRNTHRRDENTLITEGVAALPGALVRSINRM